VVTGIVYVGCGCTEGFHDVVGMFSVQNSKVHGEMNNERLAWCRRQWSLGLYSTQCMLYLVYAVLGAC
jgi:hypothetical protein